MNCSERSERARQRAEELMLILYWAFYFDEAMTVDDRQVQSVRREQLIRALMNLRRACVNEAPNLSSSACHLAGFFGMCAGNLSFKVS